jgi:hypothetical protein
MSNWIWIARFAGSCGAEITARELYTDTLFDTFPLSGFVRRIHRTLTGLGDSADNSDRRAGDTQKVVNRIHELQVLVQAAAFVTMRFPARVESMCNARRDSAVVGWRGDSQEAHFECLSNGVSNGRFAGRADWRNTRRRTR